MHECLRAAKPSLAHLQAVKGAENREGERGGKRGRLAWWEGKRTKVATECMCEGGAGGGRVSTSNSPPYPRGTINSDARQPTRARLHAVFFLYGCQLFSKRLYMRCTCVCMCVQAVSVGMH